jgi:hypothetical protein
MLTSGMVMRTGTSSGYCKAAASAGPPIQSSQSGDHTMPSLDPWIAIRGSIRGNAVSVGRDRHTASIPEAVTNDSGFALNSAISPAVRTKSEAGLDTGVLEQGRHEQRRCRSPDCRKRDPARSKTAPINEPDQPARDGHREAQQVIAVRERSNELRNGEERQPPSPPIVDIGVHREQRQRHPL